MNTAIILFVILILLSILVIANSRNKQISSIYSKEGFYADEAAAPVAAAAAAAADSSSDDISGPQSEKHYERRAGILYSGDIIDIADSNNSKAKYMNRQDYNSQIIMEKPEEKGISTNLSKLRIVSVNHNDKSAQMPIKYGDTVILAHNAYIENINAVRYVKYGEKLQSHQDGEMFRTFKLVNPTNKTDTGFVQYDKPINIKRSDNSDSVFMTVEKDSTVSTKNGASVASTFYIRLRRVYELYEKNLCICVGELLYP
jgi:hypothetical protein